MKVDVYKPAGDGSGLQLVLSGQRIGRKRYDSAKALSKWAREDAGIVSDALVGKLRVLYYPAGPTEAAIIDKDTLAVYAVVRPVSEEEE